MALNVEKLKEIEGLYPMLAQKLNWIRLTGAGSMPRSIVLPKRMDPGEDDATDVPAQFMGMPIVWAEGESMGFLIEVEL